MYGYNTVFLPLPLLLWVVARVRKGSITFRSFRGRRRMSGIRDSEWEGITDEQGSVLWVEQGSVLWVVQGSVLWVAQGSVLWVE